MPVPKTPVYKNYSSELGQIQVRSSRKAFGMQSKTKSRTMELTAKQDLRFGIAASNTRHHAASDIWRNDINQTPAFPDGALEPQS